MKFENKKELIKSILADCRTVYKYRSYTISQYNINNEYWKFFIQSNGNGVQMSCILRIKNFNPIRIDYPLTQYGGIGSGTRWDVELKAFLEREILKGE